MVAVNMRMLNTMSLLLGLGHSPNDDHKKTDYGCHDPCVLDPPEVCIPPLQGNSTYDHQSLAILLSLSWPRRDVSWFLDGFKGLLLETHQAEFAAEETEAIQEFINETQLEVIVDILQRNTSQEQRIALTAGEEELAEKDTLELAIRDANITFDQNAPTLLHQLAFNRTDPISTRMAKVGIITDGATNNFTRAFDIPSVATLGLSLLGPIIDCEIRHQALLRPSPVLCDDHNPYRTIDGSCNNVNHPLWGAAFRAYRRDLPADYFGGVSQFRRSVSGSTLPSARLISTTINEQPSEKSPTFSNLHTSFGQMVDHDLFATPMARGSYANFPLETSPLKCCPVVVPPPHPECAPIIIPLEDPFYKCFGQTCMEFARSAPAGDCHLGPRNQINQQTAYLDASVVYGVTHLQSIELRMFLNGLLKTQVIPENQPLLPPDKNPADECNRNRKPDIISREEYCFKAGDGRVNEQPQLTFLHTLWVREHNRVARILKKCHPNWNDEKLFQEARRIVGAELQQVTYNEYLPDIIGPELMANSKLYPLKGKQQTTDYDKTIDATVANVVPAAAFRYGHSLLTDSQLNITKYGKVTVNELSTLFFNPFDLYRRDGMCDVARGGIASPENEMDPYFTLQIAGKLFRGDKPFGLDLVALNIQRGRDHGLAPYNDWRKFCNLPEARDFQDLLPYMNEDRVEALKDAYGYVEDIGIFPGGVSENPIPGGLVGPTFACLIHNQFLRIKRGDRYWFEYKNGPGAFTEAQIKQLHRVTLARIMCNNLPELKHVQRWPLRNLGPNNPKVCCKNIRRYNLDPWKYGYVEEEDDHEHEKEDDCY